MIQPWIQLGTSWQNPQCAPFWSPWSRRSHLWVPWVKDLGNIYLQNMPCKIRFKGNNLHICQDELKWDQMTYHIPAVEQTDCHVLAWGHLFLFMNIFFGDLKQLRKIWFTISWVALHHLVFWLKTCQGDLVNWKRLGIIKSEKWHKSEPKRQKFLTKIG